MTAAAGLASATMEDLPLLKQRPFRMLSYTRFTSRVASNAVNFALVLLIVDETGRAFMSSMLVLALIIPATVVGLIAGVVADAIPKRPIVFVANLVRAFICLQVVLQPENVPLYFVVAITFAAAGQFASSAEGAIVPSIVTKDRLARANAINHAVAGAAQVVGFIILAPISLRLFNSPDVLFAVSAALLALAGFQALFIGRVKKPARLELASEPTGRWWAAGWREIRRDEQVTRATIELTLISAAVIIMGGLIPTYIQDTLRLPVEIGALVLMPAAIGVVVGLRLAGFLAHRVPHALLSTVGFLGFVVLVLVLTFARPASEFLAGFGAFSWLLSVSIGSFDGAGVLAAMVAIPLGFCYALVSVAALTMLNDRVPLHLQGRVLSTQGALAALASSIPVLIAGAMTDIVGVTAVFAALAIFIGIAAAANLRDPHRGPRHAFYVGRMR